MSRVWLKTVKESRRSSCEIGWGGLGGTPEVIVVDSPAVSTTVTPSEVTATMPANTLMRTTVTPPMTSTMTSNSVPRTSAVVLLGAWIV